METVARIPGMHCKLSGMITEARHDAWKADDLRPYGAACTEALRTRPADVRQATGRSCRLAGSWKQALAAFTQACGRCRSPRVKKILGETAVRFYAAYD